MRLVLALVLLVALTSGSPKRPARPEGIFSDLKEDAPNIFSSNPNFPFRPNKNRGDNEEEGKNLALVC